MTIVNRSITLTAPAPAVWEAVKTPRLRLYHPSIVPFSKHQLHVARIDDAAMTLSSEEGGGLIRRWNHDIIMTPRDETSCEYRDVIDIDAGIFTPAIAVYARWFYYMRQRRWRSLAKELSS
jgi:hypothetical protein